jgi:hypothetical protein
LYKTGKENFIGKGKIDAGADKIKTGTLVWQGHGDIIIRRNKSEAAIGLNTIV